MSTAGRIPQKATTQHKHCTRQCDCERWIKFFFFFSHFRLLSVLAVDENFTYFFGYLTTMHTAQFSDFYSQKFNSLFAFYPVIILSAFNFMVWKGKKEIIVHLSRNDSRQTKFPSSHLGSSVELFCATLAKVSLLVCVSRGW